MLDDILFTKVSGFESYKGFLNENRPLIQDYQTLQKKLQAANSKKFNFLAYCYRCKQERNLFVDYRYSFSGSDGVEQVNWREHLVCECALNNRLRATLHFIDKFVNLNSNSWVYISEQTTTLFKYLCTQKMNVIGSEYLGAKIPFGCIDSTGIRNETATALTFHDESFDAMLSFDVLEHIPEYGKALKEVYRTLKSGGKFIFSVPFSVNHEDIIVRATVKKDGEIEHHLPPEYHGDPVNPEGALCQCQ